MSNNLLIVQSHKGDTQCSGYAQGIYYVAFIELFERSQINLPDCLKVSECFMPYDPPPFFGPLFKLVFVVSVNT